MSTCSGMYKAEIDRSQGGVTVAKQEGDCPNDAMWRVTYMLSTGLPSINVCHRCIMDVSILNLMYSAIRLEKNK